MEREVRATSVNGKSEEQLIPVIRARLAERLVHRGFRTGEIARALRVTQPAVTQYLKGRRGAAIQGMAYIDGLIDPLAEKLVRRMGSGLGVETSELLEAARETIIMSSGRTVGEGYQGEPRRSESLELLRARLQLELSAAERYLELANRAPDDYTKLLLRMIASDSIRHGDVVSQIISWLEADGKQRAAIPDGTLLRSMLSVEDSASEKSLAKEVEVDHPVARLLLQWIDIDEGKHEKTVKRLLSLSMRVTKANQKRV